MEEKMRGRIKGVLEYEDGPSFRDQVDYLTSSHTHFCDRVYLTNVAPLNSQTLLNLQRVPIAYSPRERLKTIRKDKSDLSSL